MPFSSPVTPDIFRSILLSCVYPVFLISITAEDGCDGTILDIHVSSENIRSHNLL